MVSDAVRRGLERLWTDRATITQWAEVTDPTTKITDFQETPLLEDVPCKLSFEALTSSSGEPVAAVQQVVKLILSTDYVIPPGCKVAITRNIIAPYEEESQKTFVFQSSGEPGMFHNHQEIQLELFKGWA